MMKSVLHRNPTIRPLLITILVLLVFSLVAFSPETPQSAPETVTSNDYLNVVGTYPLDGEMASNRIILYFDRPLDLTQDNWNQRISIQPSVSGEVKVGPQYFSAEIQKLTNFDQIFLVQIHPDLQSTDGKKINPQQRKFVFPTNPLQVSNVWMQNQARNSIHLSFVINYPVKMDELQSHCTLVDAEGQAVPFQLTQLPEGKGYTLAAEQSPLRWPLTFGIKAGLADSNGFVTMQHPYSQSFGLKHFLKVDSLGWQDVQNEAQIIEIQFSHKVASSKLKEKLDIRAIPSNKAVPFELVQDEENTSQTVKLQLKDLSQVNLQVTVKEGLLGEDQRVLAQTFSSNLEYQIAAFSIENYWFSDSNRDGLGLYINTNTNLTQSLNAKTLDEFVEITPAITNKKIDFQTWNNNLFIVYGDWREETAYRLTIKEGLPFHPMAKLKTPVVRELKTTQIWPYVGFGLEGQYYFPRRNQIHLPLETRNVKELQVTLFRLFPTNLAAALRDMNNGRGSSYFNASWCEQVGTTELKIVGNEYELQTTSLDLDRLFPQDKKGVFCIQASVPDKREDTKIVLYTDFGLLAHWTDSELVVFAHDLFSLAPVPGAKITVWSNKSQLLGEGTANQLGMCHFKDFAQHKGSPLTLVVEIGEDFTFLELNARGEDLPSEMEALPGYNREGYDAFIYADRNLYRPGETIHASWIVRKRYGDAVPNVPLLITVTKPNGKKLFSQPTTLSSIGTGGLDIETQKAYPTGKYTVSLSIPGQSRTIGSYTFNLEEFVPQRMRAAVTLGETRWLPGKEYTFMVQANHLFGPPAAERKSSARILFQRGGFKAEKWPEYRFDNDSEYSPETLTLGEVWTDAEGKAPFTFSYTPSKEVTFPLKAMVVGEVQELGGRVVPARGMGTFFPSETLLGVSATADDAKGGLNLFVAAIQPDESPAAIQSVTVTIEREIWNYYVRRYYSYNEPNWTKSYQEIETRTVNLAEGRGQTFLDIRNYGYYRVRVHSGETPQYSTMTFYCTGSRCNIADAAAPGLIKIQLDKPEYTVGDEVRVRLESPFNGQGLVVVQGEEIQHMLPVTIKDNTGEVRLILEERDYPTLWVEATIVHEVKTGEAQVYPFSSFGTKRIDVRNPKRKLHVSFPGLPEEIRPSQKNLFRVKIANAAVQPVSAQLTLAAVDEGIHAITNYQTPDPYAFFGRPRKPDLRRAHYYDRVVYDFEKLRPGGGEGDFMMKMASASSSRMENWIKPVALWSGLVSTNEQGEAVIEMDIPEYDGQLRLVAVAADAAAAGATEALVFVRRPYMLQTSVPRFLLPEDTLTTRATLYNQSDAACTARLRWISTGTLKAASGETTLEIPAQGEQNFTTTLTAESGIGQAHLQWVADIMDASGVVLEQLREDLPLPVYPPSAWQSRHRLLTIKPGEKVTIGTQDMVPDPDNKLLLTVSANPLVRVQDALSFLIGYPYGCIEQTVSKLMPMYLLRKNANLMQTALADTRLDEFLRIGIDRLFAMQTMSGGLGFWPGASQPSPYGSVYAFHFLTLVKAEREFEIPDTNYEALKSYLRILSQDWSDSSQSNLYLRAYALYALALSGDGEALEQIQRFDEIPIPASSRYLLAAALALNTKDKQRVEFYLSKAPKQPFNDRQQGDCFNSEIRNAAVELMALRQIGGDQKTMGALAEKLITFLEHNRYGTTQETAFVVTALGGYLSDLAEGIASAKAEITSSSGTESITGVAVYTTKAQGEDVSYTITNSGASQVYISATAYGIPTDATTEAVYEGLAVKREFLVGKEFTVQNTFRQGDTYVVAIHLECDQPTENIIVADLLPAGFEVENPRLNAADMPQVPMENAVSPSHLEIRDDRVVLAFDRLEKGEHYFYYIVRAVTPGRYQYPPIHAECMYDTRIHGQSESKQIEVQ